MQISQISRSKNVHMNCDIFVPHKLDSKENEQNNVYQKKPGTK